MNPQRLRDFWYADLGDPVALSHEWRKDREGEEDKPDRWGPHAREKDCICARWETEQRTRVANDTGRLTRWPPHVGAVSRRGLSEFGLRGGLGWPERKRPKWFFSNF
jgi:hypothetical protein